MRSGLYHVRVTSVKNPNAALEVKTIKFVSSKGVLAGCILTMTTGPAGLLKVDSPDVAVATPTIDK